LAAKGIGSTSTSSAAVTGEASAKRTTTSSALFTPGRMTSTQTSSTSFSGSREHDAVAFAAGHAAANHNAYNTSSCDFDRCSSPHVKGAQSSVTASSFDSARQYLMDTSTSSRRQPHSLLAHSSSSSFDAPYSSSAIGSRGTRPSHAVSTVDRTYRGSVAGSTYSSSPPPHGGHVARTSRRDGYDSLRGSRVRSSSSGAAVLHSNISRTGAYDTFRRHR